MHPGAPGGGTRSNRNEGGRDETTKTCRACDKGVSITSVTVQQSEQDVAAPE